MLVQQYSLCIVEFLGEVTRHEWTSNSAFRYVKISRSINLSVICQSTTTPRENGHFVADVDFSIALPSVMKSRPSAEVSTTRHQPTAYSGRQIIIFHKKGESSNLGCWTRLPVLFLITLLLIPWEQFNKKRETGPLVSVAYSVPICHIGSFFLLSLMLLGYAYWVRDFKQNGTGAI